MLLVCSVVTLSHISDVSLVFTSWINKIKIKIKKREGAKKGASYCQREEIYDFRHFHGIVSPALLVCVGEWSKHWGVPSVTKVYGQGEGR